MDLDLNYKDNKKEILNMDTCVKEISINGITYIEKIKEVEVDDNYVIIRTKSAGCHAGLLIEKNGDEVVLKNSRRLWYWSGAASLSQLAIDGVGNPNKCKFPCEVPLITLRGWVELIPCTKKAMNSIKGVSTWKV